MPCSSSEGMGDNTDYDARRRLDKVEAMLCGILRLHATTGGLRSVLDKLDYAKMGVVRKEIEVWFANHLKRDEAMPAVEQTEDLVLAILSKANENGKFAVPVNAGEAPPKIQKALEECMANDWMRLIDVAEIAAHPGGPCRIFMLTPSGHFELHTRSTKAARP